MKLATYFMIGYAELHKWKGSAIILKGPGNGHHVATTPLDKVDWSWLASMSFVKIR